MSDPEIEEKIGSDCHHPCPRVTHLTGVDTACRDYYLHVLGLHLLSKSNRASIDDNGVNEVPVSELKRTL